MPVRQKGFSLVELLISLLLGSLLLAMVISLYVTCVSGGAVSLKYSRLRTDLQSIISLMETDIRRAGYGGSAFMVGSGASKTVDSSENCIVFYYDHNKSGTIDSANKMGFRWDKEKQAIAYGSGVDPLAANCYASDNGHWQAISDNQFIKITALTFAEHQASNATATMTMRSVQISITGELASDSTASHSLSTRVQVRNLEFN